MATQKKTMSRFINGIADFPHEGLPDSYAFGRSIDVRSDPKSITLLPKTIKESSTVIRSLPVGAEYVNLTNLTYIYDATGNLYSRTGAGVSTYLHTASNSHGNGISYFGEDGSLWYTTDKTVGRYGPLTSSVPVFIDDYFGSLGGVPLNTASLKLIAASTQYQSRADTATLSITGDIAIEAQIKPTTLPAAGGQMTLVSKWTENGNVRSYKFGIGTVSDYFGSGSDGALTISSNTVDTPIDSACSGSAGSQSLTATNASFAVGQKVLIVQMQGTYAGYKQENEIQAYTAGTITLVDPLNFDFSSSGSNKAQVIVRKRYTDITVNSGVTWSAKPWDGTVGGILPHLANGTITADGIIDASGCGFRGGAGAKYTATAYQGEGLGGVGIASQSHNGIGGGGSYQSDKSGGGGGHVNAGSGDIFGNGGDPSIAGSDTADLVTMQMGGGGGGGLAAIGSSASAGGTGGNGGGGIFLSAPTIIVNNYVRANGNNGQNGSGTSEVSGGGGGAGGFVILKGQVLTLGTNLIQALPGTGGTATTSGSTFSYSGSIGRIHVDYLTSYSGTTTPTLDVLQDNSLSSTDGYSLTFSVSSNGTNVETYQKPVDIQTDKWQHVGVTWDASASLAEFFLNGVTQGTVTGSLTSIVDNASTFNIGMDRDGASNPQHLYNGLIDEVRLWSTLRTSDDFIYGINQQINTATTGLNAYYKFNSNATDATVNANNLTPAGAQHM